MKDGGGSDGFARTERAPSAEHQAVSVTTRKGKGRDTRRLGGTLLRRGDELGRFELGECLGEGGMGAVVSAYDRTLDRKVAIKVLRPSAVLDVADDEARGRLLREARAMAKIKHPNVITVHEVGEDRGQVFIAMEYVEGGTLRDWMEGEPRHWRDTLKLFLSIARGLSAAHDVGLVHRDVKPENVLLSSDGSPVVTDFGLASAKASMVRDTGHLEHSALEVTLTQSGAVMGTPAYMAPEQHEGKEADARADQFAFCVMLWEALYGERPFAGSTFAEVKDNVVAGNISTPASGDMGVPAALDRTLQKGLSPDPADRFTSLAELAFAIEAVITRRGMMPPGFAPVSKSRPPSRRPIYLAIGGGVAVVIAVVIGAFALGGDDDRGDLCRGFEQRMNGIWDSSTRTAVRDAFAIADPGGAGGAFARVEPALEAYTGRWVSLRRAACEATLVRGEQSSEVYDRQIACFDRLLGGLRMVTARLEEVERARLEEAVSAALALPAVDRCAPGLAR